MFSSFQFRWICLFAIILHIILGIGAVEFMQTNSDFGELFLVQNKTVVGEWSVLYVDKGIYFTLDSSQKICVEYNPYYQYNCGKYIEFVPKNLTIQQSSQKTFPNGLFEPWFFKRLQQLQMSHIDLALFHRSGLLGADSLNVLDLSHNAIEEMPSKAFSNAWNLTEIDLSYNRIVSMASDVFKVESESIQRESSIVGLPNTSSFLKIIRLNHNNLTFIDPEWFSNIPYLTMLTLNDNFLTEIYACLAFSTNKALRTLELQNNDFTTISITTGLLGGQCLGQLDTFDISNNPKNTNNAAMDVNAKEINIINTNLQQWTILENTGILWASHNRINSVIVQLPNENLLELHLDHNRIDSIEFLRGLERLEIIDLSHNELTQITSDIFENMFNLQRLDISYNKLAAIDFAFVEQTVSLEYLDISNNLLSGQFKLDVEAIALIELNIANNNYSSLQHNLRKQMPSLTSINLNNNFFSCKDLTLMLLFMHFDYILPIIQSANELNDTDDNVRGIKCHQLNDVTDEKKSTKTSYKTTKDQLIKTFDDKLAKLETKLIDLFQNKTISKTMDHNIQ